MGSTIETLPKFGGKRVWMLGLALAIILGATLRLIWSMDIEYKTDERWTFEQTQQVEQTGSVPWLGMPSSVDISNPGMSLWVFVLLSKLSAAHDPTALARSVQLLNVFALMLLVLFALKWVQDEEREYWLWAAALAAVNPLAVLFQRKIWPPSVFPIFSLLMLAGWWRREKHWGAFGWGLIGAWLGQIQVAGFFFAAGFFAWAVMFDRKRVAWLSWLAGSCLGAITLLPWLRYLLMGLGNLPSKSYRWTRLLEGKYWIRWVTEPLGFGLDYSLEQDFGSFLAYPLIHGHPTYVVLALHVAMLLLGLVIFTRAGRRLWQERPTMFDLWSGRQSPTAFTQNAALWGCGMLLTLSGLAIHRHYMIVTFPLQFVWLVRLALDLPTASAKALKTGRGLLLTLCILQFLVSANFLGYIHVNRGAIHGDYGVTYGGQQGAGPIEHR